MTRFAIITAVLLTGAFASMLVMLLAPSQATISRYDEGRFDDKTREKVVSSFCFKSTLTTTLELLARGEIRLENARTQVYESALHYHPAYLKHIETSERGATARERVAHNLIGHLRIMDESDPALQARIFALEIELAELHGTVQSACGWLHDACRVHAPEVVEVTYP
jgi:hypothetical protein